MLLLGKRKDIHSLGKLQQVLSTADRLPVEVKEDFNEQFGVAVHNYFGLTETAGICAAETPENHNRDAEGGIGYPVDALFRVVDDEGYDLPAGEKGALWIQSANLMQGYYLNDEATGQCFNGRWFKTGDLAVRHTDGSYSIIGRIKDQTKNNYGEILDANGIIDYLLSREDIAYLDQRAKRDISTALIVHERDFKALAPATPERGFSSNDGLHGEMRGRLRATCGLPR